MEQLKQIALRNESMALAPPSERPLSRAESEALTVFLDQMAPAYPHQEIPPETAEVWREAFEMLTRRFGIAKMRAAFMELLTDEDQKFFPQPHEVSAKCRELMANDRAQFLKNHPIGDCKICDNQRAVVIRRDDGSTRAVDCECLKAWKRSCNPVSEAVMERARAAGQ